MTNSDWTPQEREESFGVIIFRTGSDGKEVLLVKTDHWGFPKGHVEAGEDGLTTAIREVKEETGIDALVEDPSRQYRDEYEIRRERFTTKKTVTYFIGSADGQPRAQEGEISEARWMSVPEALNTLSYEGVRNILKSLI